jgi:hypothetical protein
MQCLLPMYRHSTASTTWFFTVEASRPRVQYCGNKPGTEFIILSNFVKWRRKIILHFHYVKYFQLISVMLRFENSAILWFTCPMTRTVLVFFVALFKASDPTVIKDSFNCEYLSRYTTILKTERRWILDTTFIMCSTSIIFRLLMASHRRLHHAVSAFLLEF